MQRREFLKLLGIGVGTASVAGFTQAARAQEMTDMPMPTPAPTQGVDWVAMNEHHKAGVTTFLNNIGQDPHYWPEELQPTSDNGVKVFEIHCQEVNWDTGGGNPVAALTYNGRVPGPTIRVNEGDQLRINVHNEMTQPTVIHWHGLLVPNKMDGVPFITQDPIMPGETFTYEFTARNAGSHMYHSHINAVEQVTKGMLGAFIIDPKDTSREPIVQGEYVLILNDSTLGFTLNGKSFPYTQPIVAKLGDKIRVRYMNEGLMIHPMHLHGIPQLVFAKDGYHVSTKAEVGDAADSIIYMAAKLEVDAIVMSTHGRSGVSRWLFGSVTGKVLSRATCPVLVIPSQETIQQHERKLSEMNFA